MDSVMIERRKKRALWAIAKFNAKAAKWPKSKVRAYLEKNNGSR